MQVNFFEEYPTEDNMSKLDLVDWSATILVATPSLVEFETIREKYQQKYPHITFGWWPATPGSYWISGFANSSDLNRLFAEILSKRQETRLPILLDLEFPHKKYFYIKNLFNIRKNKNILSKFLESATNYNLKIYTAEYPAFNKFLFKLWQFFGLSPSFKYSHTKLPMCYSSMGTKSLGKNSWIKVKKFEQQFALTHKDRVGFGLGTIATGIQGNEPILHPENLAQDLKWARESGVNEVFIFRLGGFNLHYKQVIDLDTSASTSERKIC